MKNIVIILALFIVILSSCGKSGSGSSSTPLVQRSGACVGHQINGEWQSQSSGDIVEFHDDCSIKSDYCASVGDYGRHNNGFIETLTVNLSSSNGSMGCMPTYPGWDCSMNFSNSNQTVTLVCDHSGPNIQYQVILNKM